MFLFSFMTNVWKIFDMRKYKLYFCYFFTIIASINQIRMINMLPISKMETVTN